MTDNEAPCWLTDTERKERKAKFFHPDLPNDIDAARRLLEQYSGIPHDEVDEHIIKIRERAWNFRPYPCIGDYNFLLLERVFGDPNYQEARRRLKVPDSPDAFLDVGCFLGQVLRQLVFDGIEPSKLYGTDLEPFFFDLGYDFFRDRGKFPSSQFVGIDLLDPKDENLEKLRHKITLIHAACFFHLFDLDDQITAAKLLVSLLKPGIKNALIFGRMLGSQIAGELKGEGDCKRFMHNQESFQSMWDQIGQDTGTHWQVKVSFSTKTRDYAPPSGDVVMKGMRFVVRQVQK